MKIRKDLTGQRFGYLTVEKHVAPRRIQCVCDCGAVVEVERGNLIRGRTSSCGKSIHSAKRTHGHASDYKRTPEYTAWTGLRRRCEDTSFREYYNYGGRGITYCERWKSFENFLADMGPRPSPKHTVDRIDNNGNYEPSNCRWSTWAEQARNKRSIHLIEFQGETKCIADWVIETGINRNTLVKRLRSGWSPERALTIPVGGA